MPKNNVTDPITDQEIAFARLILSGTTTDRRAAEAVGLPADSAAYTKSKPRVRAYMLEHRAAVQQQLVVEDTQALRRFNLGRDQVLARLWEIANLDPEMTRGSVSAQVKALSMIVAIEGLIPDRRAVYSQNKSAPAPVDPPFYVAKWRRTEQDGESEGYQVSPAPDHQQAASKPPSDPCPADDLPSPVSRPAPDPTPNLSESAFSGPLDASQTTSSPHPPVSASVSDTRVPFFIKKNPYARYR